MLRNWATNARNDIFVTFKLKVRVRQPLLIDHDLHNVDVVTLLIRLNTFK
ncbi:hypothetical protein BMETH_2273_0 [methanotrophic bacterial endosymbiont of Bathymodiolus sp.]|nr:hypothetical protein BMETH_2273_0 [methanotrophic bacterial endosymbiont of Bathymodiolus sp.]